MKWMKFKWLYFLISTFILVPGVYSLIRFGLKLSIDFTGGTLLEYKFSKEIDQNQAKLVLEEERYVANSSQVSGQNTYLFRLGAIGKEDALKIRNKLAEKFGEDPQEIRFETVGPILGKELLKKTIVAVFLVAGAILFYVAWRFKDKRFGICAVLAMFHDSLVLLGSFSLLGNFWRVEIDSLFVTALLTILSFSVHDTVVVYDRIRELQKLLPHISFEELVNQAITETIVRSLNNSLTIIFMLIALLLLGGETIRWFVVALLIGTISGTYSSTFTAVPLLVLFFPRRYR